MVSSTVSRRRDRARRQPGYGSAFKPDDSERSAASAAPGDLSVDSWLDDHVRKAIFVPSHVREVGAALEANAVADLSLRFADLPPVAVDFLIDPFQANSSLTTLDLWGANLRDAGLASLTQGLLGVLLAMCSGSGVVCMQCRRDLVVPSHFCLCWSPSLPRHNLTAATTAPADRPQEIGR